MTSEYDELAKIKLLRENLYFFTQQVFRTLFPGKKLVTGKYLEALCYVSQKLSEESGARAVINLPPRMLKSVSVSVALAAFYLGHNPEKEVLVACYGNDLVREHGRLFQAVVEASWYKVVFPGMTVNPHANSPELVKTTLNGCRRGVSVAGAVTGLGADLLIIDDVSKAADVASVVERERRKVFFDQTLHSRLNNPKEGVVIAIQQRLHEDDICAHLVNKGHYRHIVMKAIAEDEESFPLYMGRRWKRNPGDAICPAMATTDDLRKLEREMNPYEFATQYMQTCTAKGGNNIRFDAIRTYEEHEIPDRHEMLRVVQSWDTAVTATQDSDYSVCTTWAYTTGNEWLLLDVYRGRHEFADLESVAVRIARTWDPDAIIVERQGAGAPLASKLMQHLYQGRNRREGHRPKISLFDPIFNKEERFHLNKYKLEQQNFRFPAKASFRAELAHEFKTFPVSRHDDIVDSVIQFLDWLDRVHGRQVMNLTPRRRVRR